MPSMPFHGTLTGVSSTSGSIPFWAPDYMVRPFAVSIGCVVNSTAVVYTVYHTFDDINSTSFTSSGASWFPTSTGSLSAATTNANGNVAYPVTALRVVSTAGSSIGTVSVSFIQAG